MPKVEFVSVADLDDEEREKVGIVPEGMDERGLFACPPGGPFSHGAVFRVTDDDGTLVDVGVTRWRTIGDTETPSDDSVAGVRRNLTDRYARQLDPALNAEHKRALEERRQGERDEERTKAKPQATTETDDA